MKVLGWGIFVLSVALAAVFFVAKHFGVELPYVGGLSGQGEIALPIAFVLLLLGILVGSMIPATRREGPWTAVGAISGFAMAAIALITVLDQQKRSIDEQERLIGEQKRSVDLETLKLFVELEKSRPPNTRFCRCALLRLLGPGETPQFKRLLQRQTVSMTDRVREMVVKCLSDVSEGERKELIAEDQTTLTNRGASFFAERVSRILNLDDDVAFAVNSGIARKEMVTASLFQSLAVAKAIANDYEKELKFKGFPNVQNLDLPPLSEVCTSPDGLASTK